MRSKCDTRELYVHNRGCSLRLHLRAVRPILALLVSVPHLRLDDEQLRGLQFPVQRLIQARRDFEDVVGEACLKT